VAVTPDGRCAVSVKILWREPKNHQRDFDLIAPVFRRRCYQTSFEKAMQAQAFPVLSIFQTKRRLEVPLFQRQYVWNLKDQWEPLWDDIARKFADFLEGRADGPAHFLGAMVLDQRLTPTAYVDRRQVIDGQQRLTTLQIFLAAMRDFCREHECDELADECSTLLVNKGMMGDPTEVFKVWPTQLDRPQFQDVITAGSRIQLETQHPLKRRPYARCPRPPECVKA
jgi:hypothetical protein